jgi:type IV secretory pathway VirB10-like protein
MAALAEDSIEAPGWGRRLLRLAAAGAAAMLLAAVAWWLGKPSETHGPPKRQVSKIAILPDTPPPPPPPPPKEEKPPPRDQPAPTVRDEAVKQAEAPKPANEPIKMEGAAGEGNSAFAAGTVRNEYAGGTPTTGSPTVAAGTASDRALERFFANSARQLLRDEIEKHLDEDVQQAQAEFTLWIERNGAIQRYQLQPTGDDKLDAELRDALDQTQRSLRLPIPPAALQPMKFRLSLRPQG